MFLSNLKSACSRGYYGTNCTNKCGAGCQNGTCDSHTGHCTCKNSNWQSQMCQGKTNDEISRSIFILAQLGPIVCSVSSFSYFTFLSIEQHPYLEFSYVFLICLLFQLCLCPCLLFTVPSYHQIVALFQLMFIFLRFFVFCLFVC